MLRLIQDLWWNLFLLVEATGFDEAIYQAIISLWRESLSGQDTNEHSSLVESQCQLLDRAFSTHRLSSGLEMDRLWSVLRPQTASTVEHLESMLRLEALADRFDSLIFRSQAPILQLAQVRNSFQNALVTASTNAVDSNPLVEGLENAIREIEASQKSHAAEPFFTDEFNAIYRKTNIQALSTNNKKFSVTALTPSSSSSSSDALIPLLARRPTKNLILRHPVSQAKLIFQGLAMIGNGGAISADALAFAPFAPLLDKMQKADEVALSEIDLFQNELQVLGRVVARRATQLSSEMAEDLAQTFEGLHAAIAKLNLESSWELADIQSPIKENLKSIKEFLECRDKGQPSDPVVAARAWVALACILIYLYVPNHPYDPALKLLVRKKIFLDRKTRLQLEILALQTFTHKFTGHISTLRSRLLEQELGNLGEEPLIADVPRPAISRLNELQIVFDNVLQTIARFHPGWQVPDDAEYRTLETNLDHIVQRLSNDFRVYDDITTPLVGFLQCLSIGLSLSQTAIYEIRNERLTWDGLPTLFTARAEQMPADLLSVLPSALQRLEALAIAANTGSLKVSGKRLAFEGFSYLYQHWRQHLQDQQEKHAKSSSLYVYRGGQEDEEAVDEEEYQQLFPNYEADTSNIPGTAPAASGRRLAVDVCMLHSNIFCPSGNAVELLNVMFRRSSGHARFSTSGIVTMLFALKDRVHALEPKNDKMKNYNIYTSPNVQEAKAVAALAYIIQRRFREIQQVWPEHSTLNEVIRICDEILAFRYVDPVAKILTKTEKLQEAIHEWQKVASKEYSTASLYDEVTRLIVSWRRLELSTWMRLLQLEEEKAIDDAKSWWFVAYENLIAVPETLIAESHHSLQTHVKALLQTLESFMVDSPAGQYAVRISLLRQLQAHLDARVADTPELEVVRTALVNFTTYYSRFEPAVRENLGKRWQQLERDVKEVVKLASWKDTTIDALRQSAKNSHRKLFKIVRKFRAALACPIALTIEQGLPDVSLEPIFLGSNVNLPEPPELGLNARAVTVCEAELMDWDSVPSRFKNTDATRRIMQRLVTTGLSFQGAQHIEDFVSHLENSMRELEKATPTTLTSENKEKVKQLKIQKRMLFAETLKALRKMGLQHNLSSNILSNQDSLATIFAELPIFESQMNGVAITAEYHFHKTINLMPRARNILREHHGDLTPAEVGRSVGYLESLLHLAIIQRQLVCRASQDRTRLEKLIKQAAACCPQDNTAVFRSPTDAPMLESLRQSVSQLLPVLSLIQDAIHIQSSLGDLDGTGIVESLKAWQINLGGFRDMSNSLASMLQPLSTSLHSEAITQGLTLVKSLREDIDKLIKQNPAFEKVLEQLLLPILNEHLDEDKGVNSRQVSAAQLQVFQQHLLVGVDAMLGAVQAIHTTGSAYPRSEEDRGWLSKTMEAMTEAINACQLPNLTTMLTTILDTLSNMPDDHLRAGTSLLTIALPIMNLYPALAEVIIGRLIQLNAATCRLSHRLCNAFLTIGTKGFCTPHEKSHDSEDTNEKLDGGTGLGEGEGAEDISKEIGAEEDLTELAEEPNSDDKRDDIEDEKDAVDMADADMEGETGDISDNDDEVASEGSGDDEDNDEMDEEAGEVDDLGPSAVDEKMWDDGEAAEKDKEGDKGRGQKKDEQVAAAQDDQQGDQEDQEQEEAEAGAEESENITQDQPEKMDQHVQEGETLDLPDDLNLEGNDGPQSEVESLEDFGDDMMDEAGEIEDDNGETNEEPINGDDREQTASDDEVADELLEGADEQKEAGSEMEDGDDQQSGEDEDDFIPALGDNGKAAEDADHSETKGVGLDGEDQLNQNAPKDAAQRAHGDSAEDNVDETGGAQELGSKGESRSDMGGRGDDPQKTRDDESFKKLGETLERWYRQHKQIQPAQEPEPSERKQEDVDMSNADFEHLPDAQAEADVQALGTAAQEHAKALDDEMAADVNDQEGDKAHFIDDEDEIDGAQDTDIEMEDVDTTIVRDPPDNQAIPNSFIGEQTARAWDEQAKNAPYADSELDVEDVDVHLSAVHLDPITKSSLSRETARALWTHHEHNTRTLAAMLTEHLRLILAPTLATKLRGDFRTGKRLNIKRIIPYIASSYKRDKIWMRRSVPSKRSYQIMMAIDDSKSMADGGAKDLAFDTLALVAKALATLEAGELCIVRFGQDICIAHPFDQPFTDNAGAEVFAGFGFNQQKTDVRKLVSGSISLFQEARARVSAAQADLWQLMLVVSDGVCEDHEGIRRLVRRAQEERIMIVFVVVDAAARTDDGLGSEAQLQSIMDLQTAEFTTDESGEMKLLRRRYMDTFPFRWWIVVRGVKELPGVLATALRQWFAEVVDTGT